jgi:hypothetical protein
MGTKRTFVAKNLNDISTTLGVGVTVTSTAPASPPGGALWYNNEDGFLYLRISTAWVEVGGGASLPQQTGNAGKVLTTNGTTASWSNSIAAAGSNAQILYNNNGTTAGSANLTFDGSNVTAGAYLYSAGSSAFTVLNDISTQYDGVKCHFVLKVDQNTINTIVDSKDLEVVSGGVCLSPYVTTYTWPWLSPVDSFIGFRVRTFDSANYITIYNAPDRGDNSFMVLRLASTTTQKRRYPFSAATIAFGD